MIGLRTEPIDVAEVVAAVSDPLNGGLSLFLGTTRPDEGAVVLHYEAHEALALAEMESIAAETAARFPGSRVAIVHRLGPVPVGEASVVVAASAPHRDGAFAACRRLIDELKVRVPIWKQEVRADGSRVWRDARQAPPSGPTGPDLAPPPRV